MEKEKKIQMVNYNLMEKEIKMKGYNFNKL